MSKLKSLIITIIIGLIAILGMQTTSNAVSYSGSLSVGNNVSIATINQQNIYCIQTRQHFIGGSLYKVMSKVTINGNTATDHRGQSVSGPANLSLAYILNQEGRVTCSHTSSIKQNDPVQRAIWRYLPTWKSNIGRHFTSWINSFSIGCCEPRYSCSCSGTLASSIINSANNYVNQTEQARKPISDKTDKEKYKATIYQKDGANYIKVGPIKWQFSGNIRSLTIKDQNGNNINNVSLTTYIGKKEKSITAGGITSNKGFYISMPLDLNINKITISTKRRISVLGAEIWFLGKVHNTGTQNLLIANPTSTTEEINTDLEYEIPKGNLQIIKHDSRDEKVTLEGVGFKIQYKPTGQYLAEDKGQLTYVNGVENAKEWETDGKGEIKIPNLFVGTYLAYETYNKNYGYEVKTEPIAIKVTTSGTNPGKWSTEKIPNKQIYVKLSGFVWKDVVDSKTSDGKDRNDLFAEGNETNDILFDGIKVRLKDRRTGETVKETVTGQLSETHQGPPPEQSHYSDENGHNGHGEYLFMDVLIDELENYYIEFEYDGLTYTNVMQYLDKDNGSKASESEEERDTFNKNFSKIEGKTRTEGVTIDGGGNEKFGLSYNIDEVNRVATLINNGQYTITANTDVTQFSIIDHFKPGQEEIKHINLGLYEREQPDLDIHKDIQNVRLTINNYEHTYNFAQRIVNSGEYEDGFNVGVRFGLDSNIPYTTAIYKSDYDYINENDKGRELKAYITYRIAITNKSSNLIAKVNSLVDYFDARYSIEGVGTKLNEDGTIANALNYTEDTAYKNDKFKKMIIYNDSTIDNQQRNGDLYVQFALDRTAISEILEDRETSDDTIKLLDNIVEINSYSIYRDGKIYAGIDINSAPGNAVPGSEPTYEDDTEKAPALKLEVANARQMAGKVFVDGTEAKLMSGLIREGNGLYDDGETPIKDVQITLTENSGTGKVYEAKTVSEDGTYGFNQDETGKWTIEKVTDTNKTYEIKQELKEGDFLIPGYIPGDYTLTYTWGNDTYTVQNYKGTIYKNQDRQNNRSWYKEDVETRYSDALDNYDKEQDAPKGSRLQIDEEMQNVNKNTNTSFTRTQMDSTTPTMGITIENVANVAERITTSSYGDELIYKVSNIDFGIVERARQQLALTKRIKTMKLTLANGQVISDITIDENGNVTGSKNNVTYMKPDKNMNPKNGYLRIELDNEMIQGAILQVGYSIVAENQSEVDYVSSKYYNYGSQIKEEERGPMVTLTPSGIVDYLDKDWAFDEKINPEWKVKTLDELKEKVIEEVYNSEESTIEDKIILYTEGLAGKKLLPKPNNPDSKAEIMLNVSKELSTTEDISLDNETEITEITKPGGSKMTTLLGNYVPGTQPKEVDEAIAETTIVTPPTGENQNYIIMITLGVTLLITLGSGIIVIKKKMFNKNK